MPNEDKQDHSSSNPIVEFFKDVLAIFVTIPLLLWLVSGFTWTPLYIYNYLNDTYNYVNANLLNKERNKERNKNAALAVESLLAYSLRGPGRLASVGPVSFANCKSENTAIPRVPNKEVSYIIDWSKVDWDSLTFGNFSRIRGANVQSWRLYCTGNCEFIGSDRLIVGPDDINSELKKSFRNGRFDTQVNTSMIKNHLQQIKLACSSN